MNTSDQGLEGQDTRALGVGLYEPSYYDGVGFFSELTRQGSAWISFDPGDPGVWADDRPISLDESGNPLDLAEDQAARMILALESQTVDPGAYTLTWSGQGEIAVTVNGNTTWVDDRDNRIAENRIEIEVPADEDVSIFLEILDTEAATPLGDIRLWAPGAEVGGSLFSDRLTEDLAPFSTIRFMDWNKTNYGTHGAWEDRATLDQASWAVDDGGPFAQGVPYEVMIDLGNELGKDIWITVPHQADADYVRALAELLETRLDPNLTVTVELSNETWNGIFPVWEAYAEEAEQVREAEGLEDYYVQQHYGRRALEVFEIFDEVFEDDDRVVTTVSGQAGWGAILQGAMAEIEAQGGLDLVEQLAIAPYFPDVEFGVAVPTIEAALPDGITEAEWSDIFAALEADVRAQFDPSTDAGAEMFANRAVAERYGLDLVTYEAGQHLTSWENPALEGIVAEANGRAEMGEIYALYLDLWETFSGGGEMTLYHLAGFWGEGEAFGLKEFGGQAAEDSPKYAAVLEWLGEEETPQPEPEPVPGETGMGLSGAEVREVALLYEAGLDRDGNIDKAGLNFWVDQREAGLSMTDMAFFFLESAEFVDKFGPVEALSGEDYIDLLYDNVLDREGDAAGITFWNEIAARPGVDRAQILLSFAVSVENGEGSQFLTELTEITPGLWDFAQ